MTPVLRRSLRCTAAPASGQKRLPRFPEQPEQTLDLSNIVPASPLPSHNGFHGSEASTGRHVSPGVSSYDRLMMARGGGGGHARQFNTMPQPGMAAMAGAGGVNGSSQGLRYKNEEHDLIASYARRLAGGPGGDQSSPEDDMRPGPHQRGQRDGSGERREDKNLRLVHELELKNAEIMREIARLRQNRATVGYLGYTLTQKFQWSREILTLLDNNKFPLLTYNPLLSGNRALWSSGRL